jgi:hypothetical protein
MLVVAHLAEWSAFRSDFGICSVAEGASRRVPCSGFGLAKLVITEHWGRAAMSLISKSARVLANHRASQAPIRLGEIVLKRGLSSTCARHYSYLKAIMGSTRVARRAGM